MVAAAELPLEGSSPTEPLLRSTTTTTTSTNDNNDEDTANANNTSTPAPSPPPSSALLGCCTLALVLLGLGLVFFIAFLPCWLLLIFWILNLSPPPLRNLPVVVVVATTLLLNILHLYGLWKSTRYLAAFRWLALPYRRFMLPLVLIIVRIESIREQEPILYYPVPVSSSSNSTTASTEASSSNGTNSSDLLTDFRKSVRRHYKRRQTMYQNRNIQHQCVRSESNLNLSHVMPILWQHEQRICSSDGIAINANKHPVPEFIQRALVITLVPDGILDLYYHHTSANNDDDDVTPPTTTTTRQQLVAFQFSILQKSGVWHWFMYFCQDDYQKAGIWWHGALLAIQRGKRLASSSASSTINNDSQQQQQQQQYYYVNAQTHQTESKVHAGYRLAKNTEAADAHIISQLYPLSFTTRIPEDILKVRLWDTSSSSSSS